MPSAEPGGPNRCTRCKSCSFSGTHPMIASCSPVPQFCKCTAVWQSGSGPQQQPNVPALALVIYLLRGSPSAESGVATGPEAHHVHNCLFQSVCSTRLRLSVNTPLPQQGAPPAVPVGSVTPAILPTRATLIAPESAYWFYARISSAAPHRKWNPSGSSRVILCYAVPMAQLSQSALGAPILPLRLHRLRGVVRSPAAVWGKMRAGFR
ncbi:hypothetical protein NDU88_001118 [Pleurodeles waltl]|uniref:Uncharacterized protein n=1 Tax=Pleurodeles waltl TaxID=8319 RepID=A0AAV7USG3_PLEWA|nr:hypothetical protein NDU88_001118 [Pleurodeles waltl]